MASLIFQVILFILGIFFPLSKNIEKRILYLLSKNIREGESHPRLCLAHNAPSVPIEKKLISPFILMTTTVRIAGSFLTCPSAFIP